MSRRTMIQLGILIITVAVATPLLAVPASPVLVWLEQPDGTQLQARQWGDEWLHGWETVEGFSIVRDETTGWWTFAVHSPDGALVGSQLVAGLDAVPENLPRFLRPIGRARDRAEQLRTSAQGAGPVRPMSVTGTANVPVILVNFTDRSPAYGASQFQQLLFGTGNWSMRDYYSEVSYGQFTVTPGPNGVVGWYTAAQGHDYYGSNNAEGDDMWPGDLVYEAVVAADGAGFNFAPYDRNGDCYVDVVTVVFQGTAEDSSGVATDIWSHRWTLASTLRWGQSHYGAYTTNDACPGGGYIKVNSYTLQGELAGTGLNTVGVFAHEYGHAIGLPDLYDTDKSSAGVGNWSLMAGGGWCQVGLPGDRPCHLDPWSKYKLGWITPQVVTSERAGEAISPAYSAADVYQFLSGSPTTGGEYFLLENRQRANFDAGLPSSGLLVWHVDESRATQDNTDNANECYPGGPSCASQHYRVALVQADDAWDMERNVNRGDAGDPFPGTTGKTTFNGSSNPNSNLYSGSTSGASVTSIASSGGTGGTMTATLSASGGGGSGSQTVTIYSDGFEGSFPGSFQLYPSSATTTWGKSAYRKAGGNYSLWCAGGGSNAQPAGGQYVANMETWFIYGPFSLADAVSATVEYDVWYETEQDYDFVWAVASINGSDFYGIKSSGSGGGWQHVTLNFADVTQIQTIGAPQVWVAGIFESDESLQYEGVYIDNLVIRQVTGGQSCTYSISPTSQSFSAASGTGSVSVTASGTNCSWTASSAVSWVTITGGASGTGNGTVSYSVAANSGSSTRTGTLTIAGQTFTIQQAGGSACVAPSIVSHPNASTIQSGSTATMSASVSGSAPFTYQWYRGSSGDTSSPISGATSAVYTTPPLTATTSYWIRVSNACGSANSNAATVTVSGGSSGNYRYLIPAIAHSPGANNTAWRSDMSIVNRSGSSASVTVGYVSNIDSMTGSYSVTMPNGSALSWQDVLSSLFGLAQTGVNQGTVQITSTAPLSALGRTYNQTATSTFGQAYPAVAIGEAISAGRTAVLPHLANNAGYRTNIGIVNVGTGACSVTVRLYDGNGNQVGNAQTISADAGKFAQNNGIFNNAGAGQQSTAYAVVSTDSASCSFWAFATVVDNVSGDPTTVEMFPQ